MDLLEKIQDRDDEDKLYELSFSMMEKYFASSVEADFKTIDVPEHQAALDGDKQLLFQI